MTLLHTNFESGAIFSCGETYETEGASGLNVITNEINTNGSIFNIGSYVIAENNTAISGLNA